MRGRAVDEGLAGGEKAPRAEQGRPLVQDHQEGHGVHEAEEPQEEEAGEPVGRRADVACAARQVSRRRYSGTARETARFAPPCTTPRASVVFGPRA